MVGGQVKLLKPLQKWGWRSTSTSDAEGGGGGGTTSLGVVLTRELEVLAILNGGHKKCTPFQGGGGEDAKSLTLS